MGRSTLGTGLTGNPASIHLGAVFAEQTEWGRLLVCSLVTLAIVGAMTVRSTSGLTTGNLGWRDIALRAPVFVGAGHAPRRPLTPDPDRHPEILRGLSACPDFDAIGQVLRPRGNAVWTCLRPMVKRVR
ncbi:hypothetical protein NRB56_65380 [Nocardia sp. RB56]|uniref:Uncharacterized protein n=1 Tax=Nocardia aurantia TaxID=2585199 RepID=A0A7K0DYQ1_9NOCA|nr:hypothetical protein [Nocardia aurantia]